FLRCDWDIYMIVSWVQAPWHSKMNVPASITVIVMVARRLGRLLFKTIGVHVGHTTIPHYVRRRILQRFLGEPQHRLRRQFPFRELLAELTKNSRRVRHRPVSTIRRFRVNLNSKPVTVHPRRARRTWHSYPHAFLRPVQQVRRIGIAIVGLNHKQRSEEHTSELQSREK